MKPLIYFDFEECNYDKYSVVIKKDRLQEILDEVYQVGYEDGKKEYPIHIDPYITRTNKKPTINGDDLGKMSDAIHM